MRPESTFRNLLVAPTKALLSGFSNIVAIILYPLKDGFYPILSVLFLYNKFQQHKLSIQVQEKEIQCYFWL